MTAASSPQPRDGEVCAVSIWPSWSDRRVKCGKPFGRDGRCIPYGHPRPAAPSEPPSEKETPDKMAARTGLPVDLLMARVVFHPEPPAETPQGDLKARITRGATLAMQTYEVGYEAGYAAALAARPSADTEKLRRVQELANRYERIGASEIAHQLRAALDAR